MAIEVEEFTSWNQKFFEKLVRFRNSIYEGRNVLKEDISQFEDLFGSESKFSKGCRWKAWLVSLNGRVAGRIIANTGSSGFVSFGFFECINNQNVSDRLFLEVFKFSRSCALRDPTLTSLKGPIQGNFFNSYRIKLPNGGRSFFGEPAYPDYYHRLMTNSGLKLGPLWSTIEVNRQESLNQFDVFGKRMEKRWREQGISIRELNMAKWNQELKTVFDLFDKTYRKMPNYEPMDFNDFCKIYGSFRYIVNPKLVLFAERNGEPLAFMIGMFDPLPLLIDDQNTAAKGIRRIFQKLKLKAALKANTKNPIILYTGKLEDSGASWSVMALGQKIMRNLMEFGAETCQICYLADDSAAHLSLPKTAKTVSQYGLYERTI